MSILGSYCIKKTNERRTKWRPTVVPTKSDSDVIFCLHLLSKILTCRTTLINANR